MGAVMDTHFFFNKSLTWLAETLTQPRRHQTGSNTPLYNIVTTILSGFTTLYTEIWPYRAKMGAVMDTHFFFKKSLTWLAETLTQPRRHQTGSNTA